MKISLLIGKMLNLKLNGGKELTNLAFLEEIFKIFKKN